ncbi:MAG: type II toxin-antitoxin system RelE/ParE family toxin [Ignavibacteriota bacterium]|nr:type II toxin-antitoxin system RelE/ParE family toxin [Ignavibacteriota bacterium]MCO6448556.1 type II toxin-antitoxin system RelE/ParE family toxin [Ignavibacterium album]MCZ2269376.1 type II toxin-antitoxin system RelE/ParE family toxin [Ignavibacteriales bacterium]QKJ99552.1 MAG: type II toxin-antitoxin system RelE/ParE family toxin [Ignavibacteriota bacterium]HOJ08634.1 type II toxin-antitoxin system RelE/ParE family toxin [Ignavibacteriaceae bacterium]
MIFSFHPEAEQEFIQAIEFYEEKEKGLGREFAFEIYSSIERILSYPKAWPILENNIRRSLVRRFPYAVLYSLVDDELIIAAIMHLHREPEFWKKRI